MSMRDVKVCLLGESGVGKSSIVMRFVADKFKNALESTIGASFMTKTIFVEGNTYKFQIWDTAGQEKYRALAPMYYRGSAAAIIVYDVTRETSFHAVKGWVHELQRHGPSKIVIAIAGNKCDLEDLREVREKDAQEYAHEIGAIFCETSAMTAVNIAELFDAIAKLLPPEDLLGTSNQMGGGSTVNLRNNASKKKSKCCSGSDTEAASQQPVRRSLSTPRGSSSVTYPS
ncbi:Ras- protein Rab-22A [Biomphalaria glabrata]|uniref:Ras-related protein Rab-22A isoform X1 n=1 Tax=Biomphalaria pfeifferi TaxID=112525 RepID=A0AAD8B308_BIOPF|nr:ras-related protein Rab-22A isoform X1 [Biomphalaria glabrata]KAK0046419.1 ras-related protein Rab-22A isoform X1 [Biomphalaria pfeifferi]